MSFAQRPDGLLEPEADLDIHHNQTPGAAPVVVGGRLTNAATAAQEAAAYVLGQVDTEVETIGARFVFQPNQRRLRDRGGVLIGAWHGDLVGSWPATPDSPCHLIVTPTHWTYGIYRDHTLQPIVRGLFFPRLAADGATVHEVSVTFAPGGGAARVRLPNGATRRVVHPAVRADHARQWCFEVYQSNAATDTRSALLEVWAE